MRKNSSLSDSVKHSRSNVNYADETDDGSRSMTSEEARSEAIRAALGQFDRRERALDRWGMNISGAEGNSSGMSLEAAQNECGCSYCYLVPVEPKPPSPLTVSERVSLSINLAERKGRNTICAILSPSEISTGSV